MDRHITLKVVIKNVSDDGWDTGDANDIAPTGEEIAEHLQGYWSRSGQDVSVVCTEEYDE